MTVVINEAALAAFFESPPVVALVERKAVPIIEEMRADVKSYFVRAETGVENDVRLRMVGNTAIVKLEDDPDGHSKHAPKTKSSRYARVGEWRRTRALAGVR